MKIFLSSVIPEIDKATCEAQHIDSIDLMERAAEAVTNVVAERVRASQRIVVFAGPGNNGGDALAVARMLFERGHKNIEVYLFNVFSKLSHDCEEQKKRLLDISGISFTEITNEFTDPELGREDVVIDGIFGSGLDRPLKGGFVALANLINDAGAYVISIDIPSGLFGEWNDKVSRRDMVHADLTLAFQTPRLAFFFEENEEIVGECRILEIGLDEAKMKGIPTDYNVVEEKSVRPFLRKRPDFAMKRDFGSVLFFAGSTGMGGAAVFAAKGCLRSGAGLATVHSASALMPVIQTSVPEALYEPDKGENYITEMAIHHPHQAVVVGPGIGMYEKTIDALEALLKNYQKPMVIDADALNCISMRPQLLSLIPPHSIITPHAREFDRLFGEHSNSEERLRKAIEMSKSYNIIIVLKGHYTATIRPTGRVFFNSTGTPAMATAGSGDVLAGIIGAFMAQGYRPEQAASIGVYLHGLAGEMAEEVHGQYGVLASDIADCCGKAIKSLMSDTVYSRRTVMGL